MFPRDGHGTSNTFEIKRLKKGLKGLIYPSSLLDHDMVAGRNLMPLESMSNLDRCNVVCTDVCTNVIGKDDGVLSQRLLTKVKALMISGLIR
ncbi:MAG: hypothetical protein JRF69_06875 [Deltaproteobacteria bacterium]|nr:hypothetical protein [Deltaproteobacteria bacterium]